LTASPINMPKLGMTMAEGIVVEWLVAPGDAVAKGQPILVIETEKAETEVEATASGIFRHTYVEAGGEEPVPCGTLLGVLTDTMDEELDVEAFAAAQPTVAAKAEFPSASIVTATKRESNASPEGKRAVAPAARAVAKKLGVDVGAVPGTGPGGRVTRQDVEAFAAARESLVAGSGGVCLELLREGPEGTGDPVLLLPGFGTDVSSFALQTAVLAERFEVWGLNPRGVGNSDAPETDAYDVPTAAADAAAVCDRPVHVVGASLGAAVAIEFALSHPERVRSLTLITPFVEARARLRAVTDAWARIAEEASPEAVAHFLAPWLFSESLLTDAKALGRALRGLAATVRRVPAATLRRSAAGIAAWSGTRSADLGSVSVPTRILVAGEDLLTPDGEALGASIPKAQIDVIAGAGHALAIDGAEAVNAALQQILS